jgi:hypothetical protein
MKGLLVGGGLVDLATLHPLWTGLVLLLLLGAAWWAVRLGGRRTPRR